MIVTDFRRRKIDLLWLVLLCICSVFAAIALYGLRSFFINTVFNIAVLIYMLLGVILYVYIKHRQISFVKHYAGMGDVLFFAVLTPIFEFRNFIYFLIASCMAGLLWWLATYIISSKKRTVPFVGISGCIFSFHIILNILI